MGPVAAIRLGETAPPPDVAVAAAKSGTTTGAMFYEPALPGAVVPPRPPAASATSPSTIASFKPVFDYTHLGPEGADVFSAVIAKALEEAVPELGRQLLL